MTVFIAGGAYDSSAAQGVSGSSGSPVTYKAATKASHGTNTGWQDSYAVDGGAGQAVLRGGFNVEWSGKKSFTTLDGQVRTSLTSGHGIHCVKGYAGDKAAVFAGGQVDDLTVRYCELGDESAADYCIDGVQGKGHRLLVEYCFIHDCDNRGDSHGDGVLYNEPRAPEYFRELVRNGHLGAKTGKGFYDWYAKSADEVRSRRDRFLVEVLRGRRREANSATPA